MLTTCIFKKPLSSHDIICGHDDFKLFVTVNIFDLHPNQLDLDMPTVKRKMKNNRLNSIPYVVLIKGDLVLLDGHHTIAGKILKGVKKTKVLFHSI